MKYYILVEIVENVYPYYEQNGGGNIVDHKILYRFTRTENILHQISYGIGSWDFAIVSVKKNDKNSKDRIV